MKAYAGIGSRDTPRFILGVMHDIGLRLACKGWTLRSGSADGADLAFERGARDVIYHMQRGYPTPEVYLPWESYNEGKRLMHGTRFYNVAEPQDAAFAIAARHHPNWAACGQGAQRLHARNVHQILGPDVTAPVLSKFVICWTKDGAGGGGTGQAIRIARHFGVPVFDLARQEDANRIHDGLFA